MLQTLTSWFSTVSSSWLKPTAVILALAAAALLGYQYAANAYKADIAELHADYQAAAAVQAKINQKEAEANAVKLAEAVSARDEALQRAGTLDGTVARLREQAASYERRLSTAGAGSCKPCKAELGKCIRLLSEGASLAGEGADLSVRIAADKDALAEISAPETFSFKRSR